MSTGSTKTGMQTRSKIRIQPGSSGGKGTAGSQSGSSSSQGGVNGKRPVGKAAAAASGSTGQNKRATGGVVQHGPVSQIGSSPTIPAGPLVAYLEPSDYTKEIPTQPVAVGKVLHGFGFDRSKEITKIGKFRYKIDLHNSDDFNILSKINLSPANLKLFLPTSQKETICFVPNVPVDFDDEEMEAQIECEFPVVKVERIMRMGRNRQLVKTQNLKVTVQGKEVPRGVRIYGCGFRAELYIFPVKQCSKCWKYGHTRKVCRGEAACQNCGAANCDNECKNQSYCRNCKQEHGAADRLCPERARRKEIVQEMAKKRIPFAEAEQALRTSNRFAALAEDPSLEASETATNAGYSYSRAARQQNRRTSNRSDPDTDPNDNQAAQDSNPKATGEGSRATPLLENAHKATEFEIFIHQLRKLFLQHQKAKAWLVPLIQLRDKITNALKYGIEHLAQQRN